MTSPTDAATPPPSQPGRPFPRSSPADDVAAMVAAFQRGIAIEVEHRAFRAVLEKIAALPDGGAASDMAWAALKAGAK